MNQQDTQHLVLRVDFCWKEEGIYAYSRIPSDLWNRLVNYFLARRCDGVGFGGVTTEQELAQHQYDCFNNWRPKLVRLSQYRPEKVPMAMLAGGASETLHEYREAVAVFEMSQEMEDGLAAMPYGAWFDDRSEKPVDDLVFFRGKALFATAVATEQFICFSALTPIDRNLLEKVDERVSINLWEPRDLGWIGC